MSDPKIIKPLLAGHVMGEPISSHHGVRCCPAISMDTDEKYIVKVISIPTSQVQLDALLLTGAYPTKEAALSYFKELTDSAVREAEILQQLSAIEGFRAYEGWQVVPMEEGTGYDIYLLSHYRPTLERYFKSKPMTHLAAVNLGLDLCAALSVCRRNGYLFVDLKPGNIFIADNREFHIGDLGFVHLDSLKYASLPERYRSAYTAPEIKDAYSSLNATLDTYAVGLILYQAYNNGQLPELDAATGAPTLPPAYADYEMAQIILKACAADPEGRWQDPAEMGQALVSYMQRNSVNDVPIVPPVPEEEIPEATEEDAPEGQEDAENAAEEIVETVEGSEDTEPVTNDIPEETETADEAPPAQVDEDPVPADIPEEDSENAQIAPDENDTEEEQFILPEFQEDETAPTEENLEDLDDAVLTDEVSAILAQADALIAHKAPDPVILPEPIDVPMPEPILPEPEEAPAEDALPEEETGETLDAPEQADEIQEETESVDNAPMEPQEEPEEAQVPVKKQKKKHSALIAVLITVLILLLLAVGAYYYYQNYYLQMVRGITVSGDDDYLTVALDTSIDNQLLTVTCTDTYGNKLTQTVTGNTATFTGLHPDTNYKVSVEISGFHQLIGTTTATYSTDPQTSIVDFTAIAGDQDGSVILNFSVQGQDKTTWKIRCSTSGETDRIINCNGHMATVTGLTIGNTYTFTLEPAADLYVVGNYTMEYTVPAIINAENLKIEGFNNGALVVTWNAPEGTVVNSWTVRCYNSEGFDTTVTVNEPQIAIEGLDPTKNYTVDVKAEGMTVSNWVSITANSITFKDILLDDSTPGQLIITWNYEGVAPADGWRLFYTMDDGEQHVIHSQTNSCTISPLLPGAHYSISFELPAEVTVFGGTAEYDAPDNGRFDSYGVTWENFSFRMCWTPEDPSWRWYNLFETDFTTEFQVGEKASFILSLDTDYESSEDEIATLFVVRDASGKMVSMHAGRTRIWGAMWNQNYTELDMPSMPQVPGDYTVDIYFNGAWLTTQSFSVK